MAYTTKKYPPITLRFVSADGTSTTRLVEGGELSVLRSDTVRRRRPINRFDYRSGMTSVMTTVQDDRKGVVTGFSPPHRVVESVTVLGRPASSINTSRLIAAAENQLRANARAAGVNIGNMIGEYRQTAALFEQLSKQGVAFIRSFRRGVLKRLRSSRSSKDRAKEWLMFRYGIEPLMRDLKGAIEELGRKPIPPIFVESHKSSYLDKRYMVQYPLVNAPRHDFIDFKVKCKAQVVLNSSFYSSFSARHGLTNPASLAWELMPFSFVCDWFINAGSVLESLDNSLVFTSLTGFTSTRLRETATTSNGVYKYTELRRSAQSFPLLNSLVFNDKISARHIANGLALWRSIR